VAAWLLQNLLGRLLIRAGRHYQIPLELQMPIHGLMRWTFAATLLLVLERLGVSATVLWTALPALPPWELPSLRRGACCPTCSARS
jgi:hypothetical protein